MYFSSAGRGKTVTRRTLQWEDNSRATGNYNPDGHPDSDPDDPEALPSSNVMNAPSLGRAELRTIRPNTYIIYRFQVRFLY